jgi:hypothetical protein
MERAGIDFRPFDFFEIEFLDVEGLNKDDCSSVVEDALTLLYFEQNLAIAHEINNPLEAVMNLLYLLRAKITDEEGLGLTLLHWRKATRPGAQSRASNWSCVVVDLRHVWKLHVREPGDLGDACCSK